MNRKENPEIISFTERLQAKHVKITVIVSPPRCISTALARFFGINLIFDTMLMNPTRLFTTITILLLPYRAIY